MSSELVFTPASRNEALGWWYTTVGYSFRDIFRKAPIRIPAERVVGAGKWWKDDLLYFREGNRIGYLRLSGKVPDGLPAHRVDRKNFVREVLTSAGVFYAVVCMGLYLYLGKAPLRIVGPFFSSILIVVLHILFFSRSKKYSFSHKADLLTYGMLILMGLGFSLSSKA